LIKIVASFSPNVVIVCIAEWSRQREMLGFPAHLPSIRTDSLPRPSSLSGNAIFQGRDKGLEMTPEIQLTDYGYKMRARNPPVRGLFAHREEISASNKTVWWGWEDSNLQPNDYQAPALSIEHSGAVN
jgi:hypothetical protein